MFAGDAGRFYHCVNVKTCFHVKTEFGHFRGNVTICYVFEIPTSYNQAVKNDNVFVNIRQV